MAAWRCATSARFDLVLVMTTPPGLALAALPQKWRGARLWIWEMDLYPDVAIAVGELKEGSWVARMAQAVLDWPRRQAAGILTLGECMRNRLSGRVAAERLFVTENWAADESRLAITPVGVGEGPLQILYSGNLGAAHETGTIAEVLLKLKEQEDIAFVFAGGGTRRPELESFVRQHRIGNARFEPFLDGGPFAERLASADIGLVTLRPSCCGVVVPSKMYALLAAGRPVLFVGPGESTPARMIREHGCGWHVEPGDAHGAVDLLHRLRRRRGEVAEAGAKGLALFHSRHEKVQSVARIADVLGA